MENFNTEVICRNLNTGHEVKAVIVLDEESGDLDIKLNMGGLSKDEMESQGHSTCILLILDGLSKNSEGIEIQ